jgi:NADPH:quinone reductase-like Zn-dependent oxidoreductase
MEATMKAVQIQEYGDADVLRYVDVDDPTLNDDDVLIRVVGSSVNPVDRKIRAGHMKEIVAPLGVDEFIDYHAQPFQDAAKDIDVVFDTIGGETQEASWSTMSPNGILVAIASPPPEETARQHGVRSAFVYIGEAHRLSEPGRAKGKIALYVGQP